ncbi:hypothetical protein DFH06DRAFT_476653 [Mycena polygramma]|nr:hypothetical protein DFH06DRAFT_476653 [Mycena polygramma]
MDRFSAVLTRNRPPTEQEALGIRHLIQELDPQSGKSSEPPSSASNDLRMLKALRGVLSLVRCLPTEILSEIFIACRDESLDETGSYEIISPYRAPTVLTRVCSRWRKVALHTARLWNHVRLHTDTFVDYPQMVKEILDRSCQVPLSITLANPSRWSVTLMGGDDGQGRWLDIVWNSSYRLRHISLDIHSADAESPTFAHHAVFPQLCSLEIFICGDDDPDMEAIFDSFGSPPLLRSLTLRLLLVGRLNTEEVFPATFPLCQLTKLDIDAALTTFGARDILVQCTALETAKLCNLFDWASDNLPPPQDNCTLRHLSEFDISIGLGTGVADILDTFSFPHLTSLSIASSPSPHQRDQSTESLLALHARSRFTLTHLSLVKQDLTLPQLISLLCVLPTLETLVIKHCTSVDDPLFEMLGRYLAVPADAPELTHQHLAVLEIHPVNRVDGDVVARAAEYLAACAGDPSSAFPQLRSLRLSRRGPNYMHMKFEEHVEERLAALCATGFLVDRCEWWE